MKKKNVFLAKVFAVALAASMAFSTPYASAAVVTEATTYDGVGSPICTQSDAFWTKHGDFYRLSGDYDVTFEFTNKSDTMQNWDNIVIVLSNGVDFVEGDPNTAEGYSEYMIMRLDDWCWSLGDNVGHANITAEGNEVIKESDWNWETFSTVTSDAKITVNAKRSGNDFVFDLTTVNGDATHHQKYTFTTEAEKDINIFFTGDHADLNILSYTINSGSASADDSNTQSPDTTSDSAIDTTPAPDNDADQNQAPAQDDTNTDDIDTNDTDTDDTNVDDTDADDTNTDDTDIVGDTDTDDTDVNDDTDADADDEATVKKTVKLNKKKATIKVGKSVKLKVKNTSKKVTWSSSNKKVAKVNKSGKVTGVKTGKATIKAKVGKKTLKCKITVKK